MTIAMVYTYSFSVWPNETWGFDKAVFDLFRMLNGRVEMDFAKDDFESFRSRLSHHGFTLREVERFTKTTLEKVD